MNTIIKHGWMIVLVLISTLAFGQDVELANEYLKNGEYDKALTIFQKLARNKETAIVI